VQTEVRWEFRRRLQSIRKAFDRLEGVIRGTEPEQLERLTRVKAEVAALMRQDRTAAGFAGTDEAANTRWAAGVAVLSVETAVEMLVGSVLTGWPRSLANEASRLVGLPVWLLDLLGADVGRCRRQEALDRKERLLGRLANARGKAVRELRQEFMSLLDGRPREKGRVESFGRLEEQEALLA
jgi:hypothetical protein